MEKMKAYEPIILSRKDGYCDFYPGASHYEVDKIFGEFTRDTGEQSIFHIPYEKGILIGAAVDASKDTVYEKRAHENTLLYQINDYEMISKLEYIDLARSFPAGDMKKIKNLTRKYRLGVLTPVFDAKREGVIINDEIKKKVAAILHQIRQEEKLLFPDDDTELFHAIKTMLPEALTNNLAIYCNGHITQSSIDWEYDVTVLIGYCKVNNIARYTESMVDEDMVHLINAYNDLTGPQKKKFNELLNSKTTNGSFGSSFGRGNQLKILSIFQEEMSTFLKVEADVDKKECRDNKFSNHNLCDGERRWGQKNPAFDNIPEQITGSYEDEDLVVEDLSLGNLCEYTMDYLRCDHDNVNTLFTMYRKVYSKDLDEYNDFICILKDKLIQWPEHSTERLAQLCRDGLFEHAYLYPTMSVGKQEFKDFLIHQFLMDVNKDTHRMNRMLMDKREHGEKRAGFFKRVVFK